MNQHRISNRMLGEIELRLSDRDRAILSSLQILRYIKTAQIQRLFFHDLNNDHTSFVMTTRVLKRLKKEGLIEHLERRVGGSKAGAGALIWHLTEAGSRLLKLGTDPTGRTRYLEPSPSLLCHTIAVTECYVQITEICRLSQNMSIKTLCVEPDCWRGYLSGRKKISLRPDLYAETISGNYEDHWFIEMDLGTESIPVVLDKCARYEEYYQTKLEQSADGIFPYVLWIVPTEDRKEKIAAALRKDRRHKLKLDLVITPAQLYSVITEGVKKDDLC